MRWGPTLPVINLEKPPCSGRSAGWRALHCRGRCRRILSRCSVRRRGKTSSPRRLCDPRSSVSCAAVGLRARFTLSADHAASSRTSQNASACAAARPQLPSTDHRQSTSHRPPAVRLAPAALWAVTQRGPATVVRIWLTCSGTHELVSARRLWFGAGRCKRTDTVVRCSPALVSAMP